MSSATAAGVGGFEVSELTTAQVDHLESYLVPLTESVRALLDATIRTTIDEQGAQRAAAAIDAVTAVLCGSQSPGPAGVRFNAEGRVWHWGNAAAGLRNPIAPPMIIESDDTGRVYAELDLGAAYEGPPGHLHGGVAALLVLAQLADDDGVTVEAEGVFILPRWAREHFPMP